MTAYVPERNVLNVYINSNDEIEINGKKIEIDSLREIIKIYISNPRDEWDKADKTMKEIEFFGKVMVSKGIISIQCERNTIFEFYLKVQNEIEKAFYELRNELAISRFNRKYETLSKSERTAVDYCIPKIISEAEPKYIWKNGKLIENYSTREI
jgi:hypothetical protein